MSLNPDDIFVFSDIHGCANEFKLLLNKIPLQPTSTLVFLGDYIDRGDDSREVIEVILDLKKKYNVVCLMGNHEELFMHFLEDSHSAQAATFIYNGGSTTVASYGNEKGEIVIPDDHLEFFQNLELFYETDQHFFVHAGVPDVPLSEIREEDHQSHLLWIRTPFLKSKFNWGKTIVHGHTPHQEVEITEQRINIDTGCVYNNKLTALHLPQKNFYSVSLNRSIKEVVLRDHTSQRQSVRFSGIIPVYIYIKGLMHQFETINYSVRGLYIRDVIQSEKEILHIGDKVIGEIGRHNQDVLRFEGKVTRIVDEKDGICYAINMTKNPFDFLSKPWG
ncbi:MAG: metallophosphoesterase [Bdellovibrionales bacterium]|nr:metallophosphoesterase [Bdellovibrionales bacterium]